MNLQHQSRFLNLTVVMTDSSDESTSVDDSLNERTPVVKIFLKFSKFNDHHDRSLKQILHSCKNSQKIGCFAIYKLDEGKCDLKKEAKWQIERINLSSKFTFNRSAISNQKEINESLQTLPTLHSIKHENKQPFAARLGELRMAEIITIWVSQSPDGFEGDFNWNFIAHSHVLHLTSGRVVVSLITRRRRAKTEAAFVRIAQHGRILWKFLRWWILELIGR